MAGFSTVYLCLRVPELFLDHKSYNSNDVRNTLSAAAIKLWL